MSGAMHAVFEEDEVVFEADARTENAMTKRDARNHDGVVVCIFADMIENRKEEMLCSSCSNLYCVRVHAVLVLV